MSRLDEECIMAVVRNRSGVCSGEIDYCIKCERFDRQDVQSLREIKSTLLELVTKVEDRMIELSVSTITKEDTNDEPFFNKCPQC